MNHLKHITQATLLIDQIPTGPFSSTIMLRVGSSGNMSDLVRLVPFLSFLSDQKDNGKLISREAKNHISFFGIFCF